MPRRNWSDLIGKLPPERQAKVEEKVREIQAQMDAARAAEDIYALNVFLHLGLPDPDARLRRANLIRAIRNCVDAYAIPPEEAERALDLKSGQWHDLIRGRLLSDVPEESLRAYYQTLVPPFDP